MLIKVENINKEFFSKAGEVKTVFENLSFSITEPDFITIIGPNGCGKSTLLNLISGIDHVSSGDITLVSNSGKGMNNIGYVWQDYRSSLLPWLNAYQNIEFPLKVKKIETLKRRKIVDDLLSEFKISFNPQKEVYKLSGGQQQLTCLLRSIASSPELLLCDEPFASLDQSSRLTMAFYLEKIWMKYKIPVLFVSHDIDESILLGSKIILLNKNGKIEDTLINQLHRPRNIQMLSSSEHMQLRQKVIQFMRENGAIQDLSASIEN